MAAAREAGAETATPARQKPDEVPSRADQVNPVKGFSLGRRRSVISAANRPSGLLA